MKNKIFYFLATVLFDIFAVVFAVFTWLGLSGKLFLIDGIYTFSFVALPPLVIFSFYIFRIYSILWQFSKFSEFLRIFLATAVAMSAFYISTMAVFRYTYSPLFYLFTYLMINFITILFRSLLKNIAHQREVAEKNKLQNDRYSDIKGNIMIIGGGSAASMVISEFHDSSRLTRCHIKCVIDDDPAKQGQTIGGIKIVGGRESILEAVTKYDITTILFAIPSCSSEQKFELLNICQQTDCDLKIIPSIYQMLETNPASTLSSSIRQVQIEDLLGREPIDLQVDSVMDYVSGKIILVTGGGGTIGSELCRQIAAHSPKQLIIFDIYENSAYDIQNELMRDYPQLDLVTLIGSVRDSKRLNCVFEKYRPQIVYHAAAHKHVPLMEDSPNETIKNNVIGTLKTAQCADKYDTEKFVLISTDKAVNPTNIMGASKRMCEMIIQTFNNRSQTDFVAVRFGNVLGSNGSVIPLFKKQIESGGPVTVTDPNIIRYFMTIPEAVTLVLQAGASAEGGEIFVLDMGKPVKILSLAENLIKLSGLTPYKDIQIKFIGLRAGEKLYEEMLMAEEGLKETANKLIHIGKPIEFDEEEFLDDLDRLYRYMYDESIDIRATIQKIVPTYHYNSSKSK